MLKVEKTMKYTMPVFGYFIGCRKRPACRNRQKIRAGVSDKARRYQYCILLNKKLGRNGGSSGTSRGNIHIGWMIVAEN